MVQPEDVKKVFPFGRVSKLPLKRGGLTFSVSDQAHTKRLDLTAKAFLPLLVNETCPLNTLKLSNCAVGVLGCEDLYEGLRSNSTLRHLNLSQNNIDDEGMSVLAKLVGYNRVLTTLDVSKNSAIGDESVLDLCEVLTPDRKDPDKLLNKTLQVLDLSATSISDYAARQIAGVIKHNTVLQELRLRSLHYSDPEYEDEVCWDDPSIDRLWFILVAFDRPVSFSVVGSDGVRRLL